MLIEDVSLGIMPIGGRTKRSGFKVAVTPPSKSVGELIWGALERRDHSRDFAGAVCDFFRECAQTIMIFGEATYEIVYLSEPNEKAPSGFELMIIQPRTVTRRGGQFVQYVPEGVAKQRRVPRYIPLSADRILEFGAPPFVRRKLTNIMANLGILSTLLMPEFALQLPQENTPQVPYDASMHVKAHKLAIAEASKFIGWVDRGLFEDEALEYYTLHRLLLFEMFKVEMRNGILSTLNEGLTRAGKELGFTGQLEIEGLPTLKDVEVARINLAEGKCTFKEVLEPFSMS
jgi:hypothetical protein